MKHYLLCIDTTKLSLTVAEKALSFLNTTDCRITLLSVLPDLPSYNIPGGIEATQVFDARREILEIMRESTEKMILVISNLFRETIPLVESKIAEGDPASLIIKEAKTGHYDLLIMGSKSMSATDDLILGSTSKKVTNHCSIPLLIIK
jgi:nucleotide-binding universal stress UspA family protein